MILDAKQPRKRRVIPGLLPPVAAMIFFAWLAEEVHEGSTQYFDDAVRALVHAQASPALTTVMRALSLIGDPASLIALGALVILGLMWVRGRRTAVLFFLTVAGAEVLDQLLKLAFHRPRPPTFFGLAEPAGFSFPSGHALVSFAFFGALALFAVRRRWYQYIAAALLIALIGYSRIYLGMHYVTDVVGGYAVAAVCLFSVRLAPR